MKPITEFLGQVSDFIWGPFFLIPLLLGAGLFLTIRLKALQLRQLWPARIEVFPEFLKGLRSVSAES